MSARCPRCGRYDGVVVRRRTGIGDRLAALFLWRLFVCIGCGRRFRLFVAPFGLADSEP